MFKKYKEYKAKHLNVATPNRCLTDIDFNLNEYIKICNTYSKYIDKMSIKITETLGRYPKKLSDKLYSIKIETINEDNCGIIYINPIIVLSRITQVKFHILKTIDFFKTDLIVPETMYKVNTYISAYVDYQYDYPVSDILYKNCDSSSPNIRLNLFVNLTLNSIPVTIDFAEKEIERHTVNIDEYAKMCNEYVKKRDALELEKELIEYENDIKTKAFNENLFSYTNIQYDSMTGEDFEKYCADILSNNGFSKIQLTKSSGDQGADILAEKDGIRFAIQCKCYNKPVGNSAVQQIIAGKDFYNCHIGIVMTNQFFTNSAIELANKTNILLWDRNKLNSLIKSFNNTQS